MKRALFTEELIHIMRSVSEKGGDANQALGGELNVVELLKTYDISALENWYASICRKVSPVLGSDSRQKTGMRFRADHDHVSEKSLRKLFPARIGPNVLHEPGLFGKHL